MPLGPDNEPKLEKVCDRDDLVRLRDTEQKSWAAVAAELGLGSPGSARRIYSAVVRPHTESQLAVRRRPGQRVQPVHLANADLATIREAVEGRTVVVQRRNGTEDIPVAKVTSLNEGTVNFNDGDKSRSVKASAILATK